MRWYDETHKHLLVLVLDTGTLVDQVDVVGEQSGTRVLRNDTESDENGNPPAVTPGLEEVEIAGVCVGFSFHPDGIPHFSVLELDGHIVPVSVGVIVSQRVQRLFVALF